MCFTQVLFGKEAGHTIYTTVQASYHAYNQQNFSTAHGAPFGKVLDTPFCKVLADYTSHFAPYAKSFKRRASAIGGDALKGLGTTVASIRSNLPSKETGNEVDEVTKRRKKIPSDIESSPSKAFVDKSDKTQDGEPSKKDAYDVEFVAGVPARDKPRGQHVKKTIRKKRLKKPYNHESAPTYRHKNAVQEIADNDVKNRKRQHGDARRDEMTSRSNTLVAVTTEAAGDLVLPKVIEMGGRLTNSEIDLIAGADGLEGKVRTHSLSPSPEIPDVDDGMGTEDCYISDSYMYNSDGDENDVLLENDLFRTTWIPENEADELDLNKSIEISFSPISSGSSTPSDYDEAAYDLSEFSSSPDEHSSLDDSVEYRKDLSNLEEITSRKSAVSTTSYASYNHSEYSTDPAVVMAPDARTPGSHSQSS